MKARTAFSGVPAVKGWSAKFMGGAIVAAALQVVFALQAGASAASWSVVPSPNSGSKQNTLNAVTCVTSGDCWAVGSYTTGLANLTLAEHWDGTTWSVVSSPSPSTSSNTLDAVTCMAGADCWAVGASNNGQTLTEHWDGTHWSVVASPNSGNSSNVLKAVSCVASADCWAVGFYNPSGSAVYQTLSEHWDGTSWSLVASSDTGLYDNFLNAVSCIASADCWAVGSYADYIGQTLTRRTLTEHWGGFQWSIVPSANQSTFDTELQGVSCSGLVNPQGQSADCWAVGYYAAASANQTLTQHWDGIAWSVVASPNPGPIYNGLQGVTCVSSQPCWAAGYYYSSSGIAQTLTELWDGTSWSVVASPNPSTSGNGLNAVTCVSSEDCWTVGNYYKSSLSANQTLIEHYAALPAPPTNTSLPVISGTPKDGQSLLTTNGLWSSSDTLTFGYQWQRCNSAGSGCANITGATNSSYRLSAADVGHQVTAVVTATDQHGQSGAASAKPVGPAGKPAPPSNTSLPVISGTPKAGKYLQATNGSWSSPDTLTFTYQWRRCNSTGTGCVIITGATHSSYKLTAADVGHKITVVVKATDQEGQSGAATAKPVGPVVK